MISLPMTVLDVLRDRPAQMTLEHLPTLRDDPDLTFLLVEIDGTILHGWSSPLRLKSASQVMWSASYHVTQETSRFILSTGPNEKEVEGSVGATYRSQRTR
jgi:hypothetical protein